MSIPGQTLPYQVSETRSMNPHSLLLLYEGHGGNKSFEQTEAVSIDEYPTYQAVDRYVAHPHNLHDTDVTSIQLAVSHSN